MTSESSSMGLNLSLLLISCVSPDTYRTTHTYDYARRQVSMTTYGVQHLFDIVLGCHFDIVEFLGDFHAFIKTLKHGNYAEM